MRRHRFFEALGVILLAICATTAQSQTGVLYGTLSRDSAGHPLPDAVIEVSSIGRSVRSDSLGNFELDRLPGGKVDINIRHLGFNRLDDHLVVDNGTTYLKQYVLEEWAIQLNTVNVNATTKKWISSELNDFEFRMKTHLGGDFIGDDELSTTTNHSLLSLLKSKFPNIHGERYIGSGRNLGKAAFGTGGQVCGVRMYVDGTLAYDPSARGVPTPDLMHEDPSLYSGVEFYPDGAAMPARFNATGASCGVLLLWSRERITTP